MGAAAAISSTGSGNLQLNTGSAVIEGSFAASFSVCITNLARCDLY